MSGSSDSKDSLQLSIVIPVLNEAGNVKSLSDEIRSTLGSRLRYEVIFVDDGSSDGTPAIVKERMSDDAVRLLRHGSTYGQSTAIRTGVNAAHARWVATLDGDCQNDPADLIGFYEIASSASASKNLGMVIGFRNRRKDSLLKRLASRVANGVRRLVLGDDCPDSGCGIRLFDREAYLALPRFDHMHRFLPALFDMTGHDVVTVPVNHRPRLHGNSKYGVWDRLWVGIIDTGGVMWLRRRSRKAVLVQEEKRLDR